jgi:hypothetical protein
MIPRGCGMDTPLVGLCTRSCRLPEPRSFGARSNPRRSRVAVAGSVTAHDGGRPTVRFHSSSGWPRSRPGRPEDVGARRCSAERWVDSPAQITSWSSMGVRSASSAVSTRRLRKRLSSSGLRVENRNPGVTRERLPSGHWPVRRDSRAIFMRFRGPEGLDDRYGFARC